MLVFLFEYLSDDVLKKAETCMKPILLYIFVSNYCVVERDEVTG